MITPGLNANIKQTINSAFEGGPLIVFKPAGYYGPFNHAAFSAAAENRHRRLRNGTFHVPYETTFEVDPNNHTT
jgi:hypothetical protein